jgi:predicted amidohydrolase YtcJ
LTGVHAAVNHSNPAERVSVHEALQLYTINAARLGFQAHDRGSLETGKLGDLVVLAEDPYVTDPRAIKDIPVVMTIIGGQVVYQAEQ